jgi:hypothetical protein
MVFKAILALALQASGVDAGMGEIAGGRTGDWDWLAQRVDGQAMCVAGVQPDAEYTLVIRRSEAGWDMQLGKTGWALDPSREYEITYQLGDQPVQSRLAIANADNTLFFPVGDPLAGLAALTAADTLFLTSGESRRLLSLPGLPAVAAELAICQEQLASGRDDALAARSTARLDSVMSPGGRSWSVLDREGESACQLVAIYEGGHDLTLGLEGTELYMDIGRNDWDLTPILGLTEAGVRFEGGREQDWEGLAQDTSRVVLTSPLNIRAFLSIATAGHVDVRFGANAWRFELPQSEAVAENLLGCLEDRIRPALSQQETAYLVDQGRRRLRLSVESLLGPAESYTNSNQGAALMEGPGYGALASTRSVNPADGFAGLDQLASLVMRGSCENGTTPTPSLQIQRGARRFSVYEFECEALSTNGRETRITLSCLASDCDAVFVYLTDEAMRERFENGVAGWLLEG